MYSWEATVKLVQAECPCLPRHLALAGDDEPWSYLGTQSYLGTSPCLPNPAQQLKGKIRSPLDCVLSGSLVSENQVRRAARSLATPEREALICFPALERSLDEQQPFSNYLLIGSAFRINFSPWFPQGI